MYKIDSILKRLIANYSLGDIEEIIPETNLIKDLGFDSIIIIQLIVDIEEEFGFTIDDNDFDLDNFVIYELLLNYIESHLKVNGGVAYERI